MSGQARRGHDSSSHPLPRGRRRRQGNQGPDPDHRRKPRRAGRGDVTATAAMRAGAGKLRIATVESRAAEVGVAMPEAMVAVCGGCARRFRLIGGRRARRGCRRSRRDRRRSRHGGRQGVQGARDRPAPLRRRSALDAALLHELEPLPMANVRACQSFCPTRANWRHCSAAARMRSSATRRDAACARRSVSTRSCWSRALPATSSPPTATPGFTRAARRGSVCRAAATCLRELSAACSRAARRRSAPCCGRCGCTAKRAPAWRKKTGPIGFLAREIADEVPGLLPR